MTATAPARPASRAVGVGLVAGLHAAVIALLLADTARQPGPATAARAFLLVPLRSPAPAVPPSAPASVRQRPVTALPAPAPARPLPAPPALAEPAPITPPPSSALPVQPPSPDPFAAPAPPAPALLAERARASARGIARELAQEAPAVLTPDVLAARRNKAFDRAFQGGSHGFTVDRYVSPDGTSVTRQTSRRGVSCYIPAPFQPSAIPRSSERQQRVNCPPDDERWQRQ